MSETDTERGFVCQDVYLLSAPADCWKCGASTRLFALMALPPFTGQGAQIDFDVDDVSMLTNIGEMPDPLATIVTHRSAGHWRRDHSNTVGSDYWMNHCDQCEAKQGDFFVQGPNGPFWPYDDASAARIECEKVEGPHAFRGADAAYSGAMTAWRNRRDGIEHSMPPATTKRRSKRR